jgi:hypothetical protein
VIETSPGTKWVSDIAQHEPFVISGDSIRFDGEEQGNIMLSMLVRDRSGNVIVKIDKNSWHVVPQMSFDKNYSSDALEILDARSRVVLQVQLLTNGIRIGGEWYDEQGGSMRISADPQTTNDPGFHNNNAIPHWFKYPSKAHWSEWAIKMP